MFGREIKIESVLKRSRRKSCKKLQKLAKSGAKFVTKEKLLQTSMGARRKSVALPNFFRIFSEFFELDPIGRSKI